MFTQQKRSYLLRWALIMIVAGCFVVILQTTPTYADSSPHKNNADAPLPIPWNIQEEGIDIVLLIDESASMAGPPEKGYVARDHPENKQAYNGGNVRLSAAKLIIDLADEKDRIAVVYFSDIILHSQSLRKIANESNRGKLKQQVKSHFNPNHPGTSYKTALGEAYHILSSSSDERHKVVIFLTDGDPEEKIDGVLRQINRGTYPITPEAYLQWISPTVQHFVKDQIPIFPLLIGDAKPKIAQAIATKTGGVPAELAGTGELLRAYAKIYSRLRPDLFIDYLNSGDDDFSVHAMPWQQMHEISFVFERCNNTTKVSSQECSDKNKSLISMLSYSSDASATPVNMLVKQRGSLGEQIFTRKASHYEIYHIENNEPLSGEWNISWRDDPFRGGLIIAKSELGLKLMYPKTVSDVSAGYYSGKHSPLIGVEIRKQNHPYQETDRPPSVILPNQSQVPMFPTGLSPNETLWFVQANLPDKKRNEITVELGETFEPIRLRKEFTLISKPFPYLSFGDVTIDDKQIAFHFDINLYFGDKVYDKHLSNPQVFTFITDDEGNTWERPSSCKKKTQGINGSQIIPCTATLDYDVPGHTYTARFILIGKVDGTPFSDFIQTQAATSKKCFIQIPSEIDSGELDYGQQEINKKVVTHAYKNACADVTAVISSILTADGIPISPNALNAQLTSVDEKDSSQLQVFGVGKLQPNTYHVQISFLSATGVPVDPDKITLTFQVPKAEIKLSPTIIDFGEISSIQQDYTHFMTVTFPALDIAPPQFQRIDKIEAPDTKISSEEIEQALQWTIAPQDKGPNAIKSMPYVVKLKLIKPLPPGGYVIPLDVYHEELPVRSPGKIELRFIVPNSEIILDTIDLDTRELFPFPSLHPEPTEIPISIPLTLKNIEGDAVKFKISERPDPQQKQHFHFKETDNEVHRLKQYNNQWLLNLIAVIPPDLKPGSYQEKIAFIITDPPYTVITPQTLAFSVKRLTWYQYLCKQIVKVYRKFRKAIQKFFTPCWWGALKLIVILLAGILFYLGGRKLYRWMTGAQNRLHGNISTTDEVYELKGKAAAYIVYNKSEDRAYVRFNKRKLTEDELIVATITCNEEDPLADPQVEIGDKSITEEGTKYALTLGIPTTEYQELTEVCYKHHETGLWEESLELCVWFLPEDNEKEPFLVNPNFSYVL